MPATPTNELLAQSGCFTCLGMSIGDALLLGAWLSISENINPSPPAETFYLLWDVGNNVLIPQVGDRFVWQ